MYRLIGIVLLAGLSSQVAAQPSDRNEQRQWLLEQIRMGEALHRDDLVRDALGRLRLLEPGDAEVLLASLRLALRERDEAQASQLLARISQVAPGSVQERNARRLLELQQPEGNRRLQQARLMAITGRNAEAAALYEQLFAGDPPSLDLALDYWRVRSNVPGQRLEAIDRLQALDRQYPGNAALRQTLVGLLFAENRDTEALAVLEQLSRDPGARDAAAQREFDYLSEQSVSRDSVAAWQAFVQRYPASPLLPKAGEVLAQQRRLVADPAWQAGQHGLRLLEQGRYIEAEAQLRRALRQYPGDARLHGALGSTLMGQRRYEDANAAFRLAASKEQDTHWMSKWNDLEASSRYWGQLKKADLALEQGNVPLARSLYQQARKQRPGDEFAVLGLADVAVAEGDQATAERLFLQARRLAPDNESAVRGLLRIYQAQSPDKARAYLDGLPPRQQAAFADLRRGLELERLRGEGDAAMQRQDWLAASQALDRAVELAPDEPWLVYSLAGSLHQQGRLSEADAAFARLLRRHPAAPAARYAHGLFLESTDRDALALDSLARVPKGAWSDDMRTLDQRVRRRVTLAKARQLRDQGREAEATALLEASLAGGEGDPDDLLTLADWAMTRGDHKATQAYYARVLARQPEQPEARLGLIESWIAEGDLPRARQALERHPVHFPAGQNDAQRRLANAWLAVGERDKAATLLDRLLAEQTQPDPLLRRDAARLASAQAPQRALDVYAAAMADADLLDRHAVAPRDDRALTFASRARDEDDWLARSLRSDVDELYRRHNPSITLMHDYGWRNDSGTAGISRLATQSTLLHADVPWQDGKAFVRLERIGLDAGRFDLDDDGLHREAFGTCQVSGEQLESGCVGGRQRANGRIMALGWGGERWAADLGTTDGFEVDNWLGGATVNGDLGQYGWSLTASRRPMSNSLLSFGGAKDPRTGIRWGGVTANGATLGLSWDQGGDDGVWASLGHHWLRGENVADNQRTRAMAGYYYRLVERADERMRIGLTVMHWRHDKDLGDYTLGQGGYYSPERYNSIGVPFSYAWRNYDWSVLLESSVSWSQARSGSQPRYPKGSLNAKALDRYDIATSNIGDVSEGSTSNGLGYHLRGLFERRLSDHWALGGGFDWRYSDDYAPSHAMLYVRYLFDPWRGNLLLPVQPLEPYSEWR
ncbi:cellulose synthase complex outer membrane protein BcsC [Pseudomonas guariconensis]|uniref:cellulose synthase complex outer membrane protein BcsC n=1 Tax=Pseudomonas TaxID=286 RepID=UPI0020974ADE|nr:MULTISPECIES: cellulose synthase complex outer membrane protein BcsC [Pseudomonas]MCO7516768.1 cellulose synthase complex outer membrane protein BcsC [Pseudomonas putida]MCO7607174.1 cellulose synthase complex outer membrane protein BcsC [Pseudomonas guariconensis]MCO7634207.1 cellulose synthase complex outer membrane protein BcsC [Pseudomonas guariconensis]